MGASRAVIFDLDGVLVLSGPFHEAAWRATAARHGVAFTHDDHRACSGLVNADICRRIFGPSVSPGLAAQIADEKERAFRAAIAAAVPLAPGCRELLAVLRDAGAALAIGSSAPVANVDLVLDGVVGGAGGGGALRPFFQAVVHAGMVARGKPWPDIFLRAAELAGVAPANCIVVEDAPAGIAAANAAGMAVVGVATGHAAGELAAAGRVRVARSLAEVPVDWLLA